MGTQIQPYTYPRSIDLAKHFGSRYLNLNKLGIGVYQLKDYEHAMEILKRGEISKVMFKIIE